MIWIMKMINLDYFDVEAYLESRGIAYSTTGNNVSSGWVGIQCPFCDDQSNHLGINLNSKALSCFKCPVKGTIVKLIMKIENISFPQAVEVVEEFTDIRGSIDKRTLHSEAVSQSVRSIDLSEFGIVDLMKAQEKYLIKRRFDPELIKKKYKVMSGGIVHKYKHRIIIPFYNKYGKILTFQSRDTTGKAQVAYMSLAPKDSVRNIKSLLYNIDTVEDTAIIVEGIFDCWRIGDGAVPILGIRYKHAQLKRLSNLQRCFILFDQGAEERAEELGNALSAFVPSVEMLFLPEGDPADLSEDDAKNIRKEIFGRIY
jgi:DNA primase